MASIHIDGGTAEAPANLFGTIIGAPAFDEFILGDGYYTGGDINDTVKGSRGRLILRAEHRWGAKVVGFDVQTTNVTLDGIEATFTGTPLIVSAPGASILNCRVHNFGRVEYGNGIWVLRTALAPALPTLIHGNTITDWGDFLFSSGIAVGKSTDTPDISTVCIEISDNSITDGPTASGQSAAIQLFFPAHVRGNFVDTVSGSAVQMKTFNSVVSGNEFVNVLFDGAFNQRFPVASGNVWENNLVHDCDVGIDHYMGSGVIYRNNTIYNVGVYGRMKDFDTTSGMLIQNNTFYNSTGTAGFIWELTGGVTFEGIRFENNIWDTTNGPAIQDLAAGAWLETGNIFWLSTPPSPLGPGSQIINPLLADPPVDFTTLNPAAFGKGANPRPPPISAQIIELVGWGGDYNIRGSRASYKKRVMLGR